MGRSQPSNRSAGCLYCIVNECAGLEIGNLGGQTIYCRYQLSYRNFGRCDAPQAVLIALRLHPEGRGLQPVVQRGTP
jgi:hypothetical protein